MKHKPRNKDGLKALVKDESIYLGDIDTSAITDMSYVFNYMEANERDFSGIEFWDVSNVTDMDNMFAYCDSWCSTSIS